MKREKTLPNLLVILFFAVAVLGCENHHNVSSTLPEMTAKVINGNYSYEDQKVAEAYAISRYLSSGFPAGVKEVIYDEQANRYIILLERATVYVTERGTFDIPIGDDGELALRVAIIGVKDGRVTTFEKDVDCGYSWAEWMVVFSQEIITVTGPDGQVYEFDTTLNGDVELIQPVSIG